MNFSVRYTPTSGLLPHSGWAGATDTPSAVGDSGAAAYDKPVIARWDCVPYQTTAGTLRLGVVAFHIEDIDRVEFAVDGGPWVEVAEPSINSDSGVVEYHTPITASRFSDGPHELRAIAYPVNGVPRVLSGMFFNANSGETLPGEVRYASAAGNDSNDGLTSGTPKLRIAAAARSIYDAQSNTADGGTVYLLAGEYEIDGPTGGELIENTDAWLTITPAPGVTRAEVTITSVSDSGMYVKLARFHNLRITGQMTSGGALTDYCWLDGCLMDGQRVTDLNDGTGVVGPTDSFTGRYATDCEYIDVLIGPQGFDLVRGVSVDASAGDVFSNSLCVVDCTVTDFYSGGSYMGGDVAHADIFQGNAEQQNVILYGITATDVRSGYNINSGLTFETGCDGMAVVNFNADSGGGNAIYFIKDFTNLLIKDSTFVGGAYPGDPTAIDDVVFENVSIGGAVATAANRASWAAMGVVFR
jgi:hypothetical protein